MNEQRISFITALAEALLYTLYGAHMKAVDKGLMTAWLNREDSDARFITIVVPPKQEGTNYCTIERHNTDGLGIVSFRAHREEPDKITRLFKQRLSEWDSIEGEKPALEFILTLPYTELDLE